MDFIGDRYKFIGMPMEEILIEWSGVMKTLLFQWQNAENG
jgi:hypothetical protein